CNIQHSASCEEKIIHNYLQGKEGNYLQNNTRRENSSNDNYLQNNTRRECSTKNNYLQVKNDNYLLSDARHENDNNNNYSQKKKSNYLQSHETRNVRKKGIYSQIDGKDRNQIVASEHPQSSLSSTKKSRHSETNNCLIDTAWYQLISEGSGVMQVSGKDHIQAKSNNGLPNNTLECGNNGQTGISNHSNNDSQSDTGNHSQNNVGYLKSGENSNMRNGVSFGKSNKDNPLKYSGKDVGQSDYANNDRTDHMQRNESNHLNMDLSIDTNKMVDNMQASGKYRQSNMNIHTKTH
ncbi:hypothetical protein RFI_36595, partial [Reticulomyxa filosa]